ncbi:MAG: bifunctional nuclease family protein [Bacteroidales bacterium]|nr:bifunctional nuclease family protein [Bacteroidales bacterium]
MVEMKVHALAGTENGGNNAMLLLKECQGDRMLPLMMSTRRALNLMMRLRMSSELPVAATIPDIGNLMLHEFGARFERVILTSVTEGIFLCDIVASCNGEEKHLTNCRAIDGIVYAVISRCAIYIEEDLLNAQYMRPTGKDQFAINISTLTRNMLEEALQHAVESENYEAASNLRDELARRAPEPSDDVSIDDNFVNPDTPPTPETNEE